MKKISIICDKDKKTGKNAIKSIVIFEDGENPVVVNYTGIRDLLTVVKYTEKNGYDILKDGIKKAVDDGYVNIMLYSNVKAREELEADILKEFVENKSLTKLEETVKAEKEIPVKDTSEEDYTLYLKLSLERDTLLKGKTSLSKEDVDKLLAINAQINELRARNERVESVEKAREEVARIYKKYIAIKDKTSAEAIRTERELVEAMEKFNALLQKNKAELSEEVKTATVTEEKKEKVLVPKSSLPVEKKESTVVPKPSLPTEKKDEKTTPVATPTPKKVEKTTPAVETATKKEKDKETPVTVDLSSFLPGIESIGERTEEKKDKAETSTPVTDVDRVLKEYAASITSKKEDQFFEYLRLNYRRRQLLKALSEDNTDVASKKELEIVDKQIEELAKVNADILEIEVARNELIQSINKRNTLLALNKRSKEAKKASEEVERNKEKYNKIFIEKRDALYKDAREISDEETGERAKLKEKVTRKVEGLSRSTETVEEEKRSSEPRRVVRVLRPTPVPPPTPTPTPTPPPTVTPTPVYTRTRVLDRSTASPTPSPIVVPTPVTARREVGPRRTVEPTPVVESFAIPIAESETPVVTASAVVPTRTTPPAPTTSVPGTTFVSEAVYPTPINPVLGVDYVRDPATVSAATPVATPVVVTPAAATPAPAPVATPVVVTPAAATPAPAPVAAPVVVTPPATPAPAPVATPVVVVGTPATPTPVATVVTAPASGKKSKFKLVKDKVAKFFKGDIPEADGAVHVAYTDGGKEKVVKVKTRMGPLKAVLEYLLGFGFGIALLIGADRVVNKVKTTYRKVVKKPVKKQVVTQAKAPTKTAMQNNAQTTTQNATQQLNPQQQAQVNAIQNVNVRDVVARFFTSRAVNDSTRSFITNPTVIDFLSNFKNEDQLFEVLDALCYGYEANILTTKDGNFRLNADGTNYLTTFTHDFLCAKAVINGYSAGGMMRLFGGTKVSETELMGGFRNFCDTVRVYGMNAKEPLPVKYLFNDNQRAIATINLLQNKLINVNTNRERGTLTSSVTDDFIGTTCDIITSGDHTLSPGAKTLASAFVDSYVIVQANVAGGNALYLHAPHGAAPAGTYFGNVTGHTAIVYPNNSYNGLYYIYEAATPTYLSADEVTRIENVKGLLREGLTTMANMKGTVEEQAKQNLLRGTYNNRLLEITSRIRMNEFSDAEFDQLAIDYPTLAADIDLYRYARGNNQPVYVPFGTISEGFDRLLGIENRNANNVTALLNNRRLSARTASYTATTVTGNRTETVRTTGTDNTATRETRTRERVTRDEMTPEERATSSADEARLREEEARRIEAERVRVANRIEELKALAIAGTSQRDLEALARLDGISLSPTFAADTVRTENERLEGERRRAEELRAIEERNRAEREAAEQRRIAEAETQARALAKQQAYIDASEGLPTTEDDIDPIVTPVESRTVDTRVHENGPAVVDQTDSTRVQTDIGEAPYTGSAQRKNQLETMRRILLESPIDGEELLNAPSAYTLEKRMG